jgi:hypothetical protein
MHAASRCHEGHRRCDGREHTGPDSISFADANRNPTPDAFADTGDDTGRHGCPDADFGSSGYAFANDHGVADRDQPAVTTHDRDSCAGDRHAELDAGFDIGSFAESCSNARTD